MKIVKYSQQNSIYTYMLGVCISLFPINQSSSMYNEIICNRKNDTEWVTYIHDVVICVQMLHVAHLQYHCEYYVGA